MFNFLNSLFFNIFTLLSFIKLYYNYSSRIPTYSLNNSQNLKRYDSLFSRLDYYSNLKLVIKDKNFNNSETCFVSAIPERIHFVENWYFSKMDLQKILYFGDKDVYYQSSKKYIIYYNNSWLREDRMCKSYFDLDNLVYLENFIQNK